jgi:hypothetical protein
MTVSLRDDSAFIRWRGVFIIHDDSQLGDPCAALDNAKIPHIVGLHYRYQTPTGKPLEAEPWIMVPFQDYSAACALLFSMPQSKDQARCPETSTKRYQSCDPEGNQG